MKKHQTFIVESPTQSTFPWQASLIRYEKWVNRARGEKFYKALFFYKGERKMRYSRKNNKTATGALEYASRFRSTVARLEKLGYFTCNSTTEASQPSTSPAINSM